MSGNSQESIDDNAADNATDNAADYATDNTTEHAPVESLSDQKGLPLLGPGKAQKAKIDSDKDMKTSPEISVEELQRDQDEQAKQNSNK
jgi:hypothetical protein